MLQLPKKSKGRKRSASSRSVNSSPALAYPHPRVASLSQVSQPWAPLFPTSVKRRLRYASSTTINSVSGVPGHYLLRANDLFDPDYTGTGHQPMGFDQMMIFYDHFVVVKSTLTATFINMLTNSSLKAMIRVDGNNVVVSSSEDLCELGGSIYDTLGSFNSSSGVKSLSLSVDVAKYHGQNPLALTATESLTGSASASPADGVYFHLSVWSPDGATNLARVQFVIEFEAVFFEPRTPSASLLSSTSRTSAAFQQHQLRKQLEQKDSFGITPKGYGPKE